MTQTEVDQSLLGRIGHQLRRQNWFVVATEFVVVVLGVFLGLQASNWNDERLERRDEEVILGRLHDETGALLEVVRDERRSLQSSFDSLISAQPLLFAQEPARALTPAECQNVAFSHIYRKPSDELPILGELIETGRFDRLRDEGLKRQLREYILFRDRQRGIHEERTNELFRLYSRYPDAFAFDLQPSNGEPELTATLLSHPDYDWVLSCDVKAMQSNQQFQNEYFDNMGRNGNFLQAYGKREEILQALYDHLGTALGAS